MVDTSQKSDLRDRVDEDRGLIKKIELAIPGFRGYRKREDLRIADSLLRNHLANLIKTVGTTLEGCREALAKKMDLMVLEDIGKLVNKLTTIENRVRHAEQGYTGISSDFRIDINELNDLYEWDLKLLDDIGELDYIATSLRNAIGMDKDFKDIMRAMESKLIDFNQLFDKRIQIISKVDVKKRK